MASKKESKKPEIRKIVLSLGEGREISLTVEAARELYAAMGELFGEKEVVHRWYPYTQYTPPYYWTYISGSLDATTTNGTNTGTSIYELNDASAATLTSTT